MLDKLAIQALISPLEGSEPPIFAVAAHLRERLEAHPHEEEDGADAAGVGH